MVTASAYLLLVPEERREVLLGHAGEEVDNWYYEPLPSIAEPVPRFSHSRRAPLVVFAAFENGKITHIADGRKGASAGTNLVRLNMTDLQALSVGETIT